MTTLPELSAFQLAPFGISRPIKPCSWLKRVPGAGKPPPRLAKHTNVSLINPVLSDPRELVLYVFEIERYAPLMCRTIGSSSSVKLPGDGTVIPLFMPLCLESSISGAPVSASPAVSTGSRLLDRFKAARPAHEYSCPRGNPILDQLRHSSPSPAAILLGFGRDFSSVRMPLGALAIRDVTSWARHATTPPLLALAPWLTAKMRIPIFHIRRRVACSRPSMSPRECNLSVVVVVDV